MSFSGGTASSAILAVAAELARREGLELPLAATIRTHGARRDETVKQERVIVHLGLTDWVRLEFADELDLVGPFAMRVLRRHGFLWPSHAHSSMPMIEWASGGSLITGLGHRNALGEPAGLFSRDLGPLPWLRPSAQREVRARWRTDAASRPRAEQLRSSWWATLRQVQIGIELLRRLGEGLRVLVCHPLIDSAFTMALSDSPAHGRSPHALFGDLLPSDLLSASTASIQADGFWGSHSRELAEAWQGEGAEPGIVDADALREQWSLPRPDPRTFLLLQSVALARENSTAGISGARAAGSQPA